MKIVVMSDSHGCDDRVFKIIDANQDADYFLHAGDLCSDDSRFPGVIFVKGNNDYYSDFPSQLVMNFEGVRILMTHSHRIYGDKLTNLARLARENKCQIAIFGHTHRCCDETVAGVRLLNPGSLLYNRDYSSLCYIVITIHGSTYKVEWKNLEE